MLFVGSDFESYWPATDESNPVSNHMKKILFKKMKIFTVYITKLADLVR